MAIKSLADTVEEKDIIISEEETNEPNILIEDTGFGISGNYGGYSLVQLKTAHRTGTLEDAENNGKVIRYQTWVEVPTFIYGKTIFDCLDNYEKYTTLYKIKKLKKASFKEVQDILTQTHNDVVRTLKKLELSKEIKEHCEIFNSVSKLQQRIDEANLIFAEVDKLAEMVKRKRSILIKDEPTKHRTKKEEE